MHFRLNEDVLKSIFGSKASTYSQVIRMAASGREKEFSQFTAGHRFCLMAFKNAVVAVDNNYCVEGSTRVSIQFYDEVTPNLNKKIIPETPYMRLDIPTLYLREKSKPLFWLYNIRFQMMLEDEKVDAAGMRPFRVGYFGITKRNVFQRFKEHQSKVTNGTGHILHKAWRGLIKAGVDFHPVIQISGLSQSLSEIYDYEERAVAERSLTPMGLNAIPGGYAGIRMLHQLALLSKQDRVFPDDRDNALELLESSDSKKCTHYRSGHMRKLSSGKTTWVSPCWVNLSESAVA